MSTYQLTKDEEAFLNLGLNCHLLPKYNKLKKQVEIEVLYQRILELEKSKKITVNNNLADQLRSEATKHRNTRIPNILSNNLRNAAKRLKENTKKPINQQAMS